MEIRAIHKRAMIKPQLARLTMDLIRGKDVIEARSILENTNTKASRLIMKVLNSAVSNAINNESMDENNLIISKCVINPGPVYKRIRFASRGNIDRHDKRTSHIEIYVKSKEGK